MSKPCSWRDAETQGCITDVHTLHKTRPSLWRGYQWPYREKMREVRALRCWCWLVRSRPTWHLESTGGRSSRGEVEQDARMLLSSLPFPILCFRIYLCIYLCSAPKLSAGVQFPARVVVFPGIATSPAVGLVQPLAILMQLYNSLELERSLVVWTLDSFPAIYKTWRFNTEFTRALHLSLA
jgi:hypothetical protein